jgi:tetratricopeptide (TPR) repeat protein
MPPDAAALEGFSPLLSEFWQQAGLEDLWNRSQPAYEEVIAKYHAPVSQAILDANLYMRNPTSGVRGRRFQVYVDLLGAPNQVHTRSYSDDYFVVVTASSQPRVRDIRHAYLHYVLDPLCIRNAGSLEKKRGLGDLSHGSPILDEAYKNDFVLLTGMSLVKAVESRMDGKAGAAAVDQAMREGFILTAYFQEALVVYEKQEQALRLYLPSMFDAIDVKKEDRRIAQVEFATKAAERMIKPADVKPAPLEGMDKVLADAEGLYAKRDLDGARKSYRQVLEQPGSQQLHSRAYFGLARIAILEKNPELAQQLFEKTIDLKPEPFERAWAYVYLARLSAAAQEPVEARKHYEAALAVEGASEGARKAAKQEMDNLAAKKP